MPNYGFICEECGKGFERFLRIDERENPITEECPHCKTKGKINKDFSSISVALNSDTTLTPDKATGGRWSELMSRMKTGLSPRFHKNLDSATTKTGRRWLG